MHSERFADAGRGITLCYEQIGRPAGEPVLLVAGLGQQLHAWPDEFCADLAARGYCVVRYDNRDVGRSTHMSYRPANPLAMFLGRVGRHQYHLGDMARDAMGLLDALGHDSAHVVGMSMGGMIAQTLAAHTPSRVRSLTSITSTTGAPRIGRPALSTWLRMLGQAPKTGGEAIDRELTMYRHSLMSINFDGVVHGTRAFLPILVDQGKGSIVNTSSVYGLGGVPHHTTYCASKFAVRGFTDALRQELRGTGVDAVNIHPGGIRTNIARNGRFRQGPEGLGRTQEQYANEFEAMSLTTPDKAAKIIHQGLVAGKARILVGPDAYFFDAVTRIAPTHYFTLVSKAESLLQKRT